MIRYRIMTEGSEGGQHFLITHELVAQDQGDAEEKIKKLAKRENWVYVGTEEIEELQPSSDGDQLSIVCVTGRAYFDE